MGDPVASIRVIESRQAASCSACNASMPTSPASYFAIISCRRIGRGSEPTFSVGIGMTLFPPNVAESSLESDHKTITVDLVPARRQNWRGPQDLHGGRRASADLAAFSQFTARVHHALPRWAGQNGRRTA